MVVHTEEKDVHLFEYHGTYAGRENACTKALLHQKVTGGEVIITLVDWLLAYASHGSMQVSPFG